MNMACLPVFIFLLLISFCKCDDKLTQAKPLISPGDVLVSKGGIFALGFFYPSTSNKSLFLGIWYHNISERTYVWVANRDNPIISPSSAMLTISNSSNLVLSNSNGETLWATTTNITRGNGAQATLLDSGNLVLQLLNDTTIWQSFDHPTDSVLPNMRAFVSYKSQLIGRLVAWKSPDDPSTGDFSCSGSPNSDLQLFFWKGNKPYRRIVILDSFLVSGKANGINNSSFIYQTIVNTEDEFYIMFTTSDGSPFVRFKLDYMGTMKLLTWNSKSSSWTVLSETRADTGDCEPYASCGPFGYCDLTLANPRCQCLDGFEPASSNSSIGCRRKQQLTCGDGDHFVTLPGMKIPDKFLHIQNKSFNECVTECSANCSCTAYAYSNLTIDNAAGTIANQSRCLVWMSELVDTGRINTGDKLYLRLANSPVGIQRKKVTVKTSALRNLGAIPDLWDQNLEFACISFEDVTSATNNFHDTNMLGKGGFGIVYKVGILGDGKEFAVKRLSKGSGQGVEEFTNEVFHSTILTVFFSDHAIEATLDWPTRFKIIKGVARGLLYLHQDSRMTIIHRDLKASNILLDADMNPKISDFGMARIFGGNQQQESTKRVVGTYGYMSPEYAMEGIFSVKSDTYSYGILLLEIAWNLWKDERQRDFVDKLVLESCCLSEDSQDARPLMSLVVSILDNEDIPRPMPKEPIYFVQRHYEAEEQRKGLEKSVNNVIHKILFKYWLEHRKIHVSERQKVMDMAFLPFLICLLLIHFCKCEDQLTEAKQLRSPGDMLISKGRVFALGFFSPTASNKSLFLGIWHHNIPERTYVWVANRNNPITNPSSTMLAISNSSNLVLSDFEGHTLWTTARTNGAIITGGQKAYAVLLDSGNLVLRLPNNTIIWQSFDHPTDTTLPNMKFLVSNQAQVGMQLIAWKAPDDPSTGEFSCSGDPRSNFQVFIWHGTRPYFRFIVLHSASVVGAAYGSNITSFVYQTIMNTKDEFYIVYTTSNISSYVRITLDYMGTLKFMSWKGTSSSWTVFSQYPKATDYCDTYASCGPFGYCNLTPTVPRCQCLDGFEPVSSNSSRGCRRKQQLRCGDRNHFVHMAGMKVPDRFQVVHNQSFDECAAECSRNCSCTAYAYSNRTIAGNPGSTTDQSRCLLWTGVLVDTATANIGEHLYIRLANSPGHTSEAKKKIRYIVMAVVPVIACLLLVTCTYLVWKWQSKGKQSNDEKQKRSVLVKFRTSHELFKKNLESQFINFEDVASATNNFSDSNILGKGGFGKVYKGKLEGGKEIAVKRLGTGSRQGIEHFTNEVVLIAKLQHKNLVRLLGCCIHGDEKLLIYEYLPNKSLDYFLFDDSKRSMLDWQTRFNIIKGVARGLVYLHQDSRMRIIHRDLKASNILLDEEMNPKISDFGMARIFGGNQHQANTKHVVGTYGYMSPEYAMEGIFSVKSDTYSFGVLVLEIISGSKIGSPHLITDFPNLIACAWSLWKDRKPEDFVDSFIRECYSLDEFLLCMHAGLLCVQEDPNVRPLMSSVVFMFENEATTVPTPRQPAYFVQRNYMGEGAREDVNKSVNGLSLTTLQGR
uniref:non-specific serine/threonine protein kinase n=1 Tax=Leersia perrieri TaxID=77586 RepID=A0A0D9W9Z6_9ORYZ